MSWSGWYLRNSSISANLRSVIGVATPFRWLVVLLFEGNAPVTFSVNHRPDSPAFLHPTWDVNAWSRTGVDQMARLRVFQANGGSVVQACLQGSIPLALKVSRSWLEQARRSIQQGYALPDEVFDNLPALRGRRSMLTRALRGLSLGV